MHPEIETALAKLRGERPQVTVELSDGRVVTMPDPDVTDEQWAEWLLMTAKIAAVADEAVTEEPGAASDIARLVEAGNEGKLSKRKALKDVAAAVPGQHWSDVTVNRATFPCGCEHAQWHSDRDANRGNAPTVRHHAGYKRCENHRAGNAREAWGLVHQQLDLVSEITATHPGLAFHFEPGIIVLEPQPSERATVQGKARLLVGQASFYRVA